MPSTVFPAPGCQSGQQFLMPFQGFDISRQAEATFSNLLVNSSDLTKSDWIKGINGVAIAAQTPFDIVSDYINESAILAYQPIYVYKNEFGEHTIISSSSTQYFGQQITVQPGTEYTFSFYAKRGTATNATYKIYDVTNAADIISSVSYYNNINSTTWSRIITTFNTGTATSINVYMLWDIPSGTPGSIKITGPQLDLGSTAKSYDPTGTISWAAQGLTSVAQKLYGRNHLGTFNYPSIDFEPIPVTGQSSVTWNVVNDYIFDNSVFNYSSAGTNNRIDIPEQTTRPYLVGDNVTVTGVGYRQTFQVIAFTKTSITINSTAAVPINGAFIVNPAPQVYPQSLVPVEFYKNNLNARENFFASTYLPNNRAIKYFIDRALSFLNTPSASEIKLLATKVKSVSDQHIPGKVLPRTNIHTPIDRPTSGKVLKYFIDRALSFLNTPSASEIKLLPKVKSVSDQHILGKVLPRTNIYTPVDRRSVSRTETLTATGNQLISRFPNGIPALNGTNLFLSQERTAVDVKLTANSFRLESFDNQGIYPGDIFNVAGQNNVKYNSVNQYIYDLDVLSVTTSANGSQQTLYFNTTPDTYYIVNYFPVGFYVRINDSVTNTSYIVQVIASTASSITFNTIPGFPNRVSGQGLTIQSATSFVYPKTKVDSDMYAHMSLNGINLSNYPTNPRENLSVSEVKPNFRSATELSIERNNFGDILPQVNTSTGIMSTFDSLTIPGDFRLPVTAQSADSTNNAVIWYRDDLDVLSIIPSVTGVKIAYFPMQDAVPFPTGSQIRIKNFQTGFNEIQNVIQGTNFSVSFNGTVPIGSIIERISSTVYPQQYVITTTAPTSARENLYYSTLAVGFRSNHSFLQENLFATDSNNFNTAKLKTASVVKTVFSPPTISRLQSAIKVVSDKNSLTVNLADNYRSQLNYNNLNPNNNAIAKFQYFSIAPGFRYNSTVSQGRTIELVSQRLSTETLRKPISILTNDKVILSTGTIRKPILILTNDGIKLFTNKLKSLQNLKDTVVQISTDKINRINFKSDTVQLFNTPLPDQIRLGFVVKSDRIQLSVDKLFSATVLKTDRNNITLDQIDIFKLKSDRSQVIETPISNNLQLDLVKLKAGDVRLSIENINKQLSKLVTDQAILTFNKLSSATVLKSDRNHLNIDQLEKFKSKSNNSQVFDIPVVNQVRYGLVVRDTSAIINLSAISIKSVKVQGEISKLETANINKFKTPSDKTQIFADLQTGKLTASTVIKQSIQNYQVGQLKSNAKAISDRNKFEVFSTDNYKNQYDYNNLTPANTAMSNLQYFIMGPGIRYNSSIQQGKIFEDIRPQIKADSLDTFISKTTVLTNVAPSSPREYLFYAELARGYKYGVLMTPFGSALSTTNNHNINTQFLERDYYRLKGLIFLDSSGQIVRFKTGNFKKGSLGIVDVAAPKKEPIQFWN